MTARGTTWVPGAAGTGNDVTHLPYAVFSRPGGRPSVGVRIGAYVLDVAAAARTTPDGPAADWLALLDAPTLNPLMAAGRPTWDALRAWLVDLLTDNTRRGEVEPHLVDLHDPDGFTLHLPFAVADYVDFYCSIDHATNVGRIFRPDAEPLLPNWRYLPVGYHGRSSTVVVSGTEIIRPSGQRKPRNEDVPTVGPSQRLDIEAELGFVVGCATTMGDPVSTGEFADHVFGVVLLNDWSARDIQAWEYVPLGPFLGKSFATSVSAWVTPLAALESARTELPRQDPEPFAYLRVDGPAGYDLALEVRWNGTVVSRPPYASMYWSPAQMLAHLTSNGAATSVGDLYASGTISGPDADQRGSFLELSWGGKEPLTLDDGSVRTFLEDGDEVTITATAPAPGGGRIDLGEVTGRVRSPGRDGTGQHSNHR